MAAEGRVGWRVVHHSDWRHNVAQSSEVKSDHLLKYFDEVFTAQAWTSSHTQGANAFNSTAVQGLPFPFLKGSEEVLDQSRCLEGPTFSIPPCVVFCVPTISLQNCVPSLSVSQPGLEKSIPYFFRFTSLC